MAMQIIDRGPLRAELALRAGQAQADALQRSAFIMMQGLQDYRKDLEHKQDVKLAVMSTLASKYGFNKMGPDFMRNFEALSGIQFPRGEDGQPLLPQTDEEALKAKLKPDVDAALQDPKTRQAIAAHLYGMTGEPKSLTEEARLSAKDAEDRRFHDVQAGISAMNARANMLRALSSADRARGSKNTQALDEPSGFMPADPNDPKSLLTVPWDGKGRQLTQREFNNRANNRKLANSDEDNTIAHLNSKLREDTATNKNIGSMLGIAGDTKRKYPQEVKDAMRDTAYKAILTEYGVDVTKYKDSRGFMKKLYDFVVPGIATTPTAVKDAEATIVTGANPNTPKTPELNDDQMQALVKQRMDEGADPYQMFEQAPDKNQMLKIFQNLGVKPLH
jgi:hypothetical protein